MKSKNIAVMVGAGLLGLWSPMAAMATDTNNYFTVTTPVTTQSNAVLLERTCKGKKTVMLEGANGAMVLEKTVSSPAVIERTTCGAAVIESTTCAPVVTTTNTLPIVIEDRIVKQKHAFKLGIWPLFDFELL
jgi:hypothetical protein